MDWGRGLNIDEYFGYPREDTRIVTGEGVYAIDSEGNRYLDCASGTFNLSLGYRHPAVTKAIKEAADVPTHIPSWFRTDAIDELAQRLVLAAPEGVTRAHLKVSSGSAANETAVKMAMRKTGGAEIISLFRAHHGQTFATTAISGNSFRRAPYPPVFFPSLKVPEPNCRRCFYGQERQACRLMCVSRIEEFLEHASVAQPAAFIIEPILGSGGNIVPPSGYLEAVRLFCDEHKIPLIFDEVQTGIGRTGHMFAADAFDIRPDMLTVAKGLGAGAPIAAVLTTEDFIFEDAGDLSFTYGANILAAHIANAALSVIDDPIFLQNVRTSGQRLREGLNQLKQKFDFIADVRGVGLMNGVEVVDREGNEDPNLALEICDKARRFGLLLRSSRFGRGGVIKFRPPLILSEVEADQICDSLEQTLKVVSE